MPAVPVYKDLNRPDETGLPLAWGLWGPEDQVGTLNRITPERVVEAAQLVKRGVRFNLDLPLHVPYGLLPTGAHRRRQAPELTLFKGEMPPHLVSRDDKMDEFYLQCSSQWDSLTHMGDARHGFYNGVQDHQVTQREGTRNGIDQVADFGLAGRAVLVDLVRWFERKGESIDPAGQRSISVEELAACIADQGVTLQTGDILLLRMGWVRAFLGAKEEAARSALFNWSFSGLSGEEDMWEFLWDQGIAAVASDTVTVERWPVPDGRPSLHLSIARLGMTLGEMFDLEALADDSAKEGNYLAFFTSSPLNVRGGVGSPPNAIAIR